MKFLEKYTKYSPLILRLVLGIAFIAHGYGKLLGTNPGMPNWLVMIGGLGMPSVIGYLVAIGEFFGGILILLGILTRYASLVIAVIMVGAMLLVKFKMGYLNGWELDIAYFTMAVSLMLSGGGDLSVDKKMKW